jgi:hypothetical protein
LSYGWRIPRNAGVGRYQSKDFWSQVGIWMVILVQAQIGDIVLLSLSTCHGNNIKRVQTVASGAELALLGSTPTSRAVSEKINAARVKNHEKTGK